MSTQATVQADSAATLTITAATVFFALPGATTGTGAANSVQVLASDMKTFFEGGTADEFLLTTAIATPSALAATTFVGFASTVSGAVLMGFGTTHDVALKNRAGTTALGVTANTVNVTAAGQFDFVTKIVSSTALATPSALAATAFNAFASTVSGATLMGFGTTGDVTLKNRAGTDVFRIPSNTTNIALVDGSVTTTFSAATGAAWTINETSATYAGGMVALNATRAANAAFNFLELAANSVAIFTITGTGAISTALTVNNAVQLGTAAGTDVTTIGGTGYGAGVASLRLNGLTTAAVNNQVGTLTNAPVAGNAAFWVPISIAGTIRYFPCW